MTSHYSGRALRARRSVAIALATGGALLALTTSGSAADTQTVTFTPAAPQTLTSTGAEQQFVVPSGASALHVVATGAPGGGTNGGRAHQVSGEIAVTGGETLYV